MLRALVWDVDGTLAETERDGHLPAFNAAFEVANVPWRWSVERYGELLGGKRFDLRLQRKARPKAPQQLAVIGQPVPRVELPGKVMGTHVYVHNLRLPGMLHGRVVRAPRPGAMVDTVDEDYRLETMPRVRASDQHAMLDR